MENGVRGLSAYAGGILSFETACGSHSNYVPRAVGSRPFPLSEAVKLLLQCIDDIK